MDSGYLEPGETMDDDYNFSHVLLPEEIIGIIDQLLCHEVSKFRGMRSNIGKRRLEELAWIFHPLHSSFVEHLTAWK